MSQCQQCHLPCDKSVNYKPVVIGDRRLPFLFELDESQSILFPMPGQNQRFCYRVTGTGADTSEFVDLSHWVLSICPSITLDQITNVEVTIGGVPQTVVIGENVELFIPPDTDPTTVCSGLKFDFEINKVQGGQDSVGLFCFELTTPFPVGGVNVCLFGGGLSASGLFICGPVRTPPPPSCERTISQFANVCVPVTIRPFAFAGEATTICCGEPMIGDLPCSGTPGGVCEFTVSQLICVEVPISFGAHACTGRTSVDCQTTSTGECSCPESNGSSTDS